MKSRRFLKVLPWWFVPALGLCLSACAPSTEKSADDATSDAQENRAIASMVVDVPVPTVLASAASAATVNDAQALNVPTGAQESVAPEPTVVREFNPVDFPDACNDYVDEVLQCIKIMDQASMDGTASLQMQLSEMQASWLKETDQAALNQTCQLALMDVEPVLQDLGC